MMSNFSPLVRPQSEYEVLKRENNQLIDIIRKLKAAKNENRCDQCFFKKEHSIQKAIIRKLRDAQDDDRFEKCSLKSDIEIYRERFEKLDNDHPERIE